MGNTYTAPSFERETSEVQAFPNYWAEKASNLIDEHYAEIQGAEDVCIVLGISPSYLRQIFNDGFRMSAKTYITSVKIENAKALLGRRSVSVREVAKIVGYRQTVTFEKAIKKLVGVPPSKYRGGG